MQQNQTNQQNKKKNKKKNNDGSNAHPINPNAYKMCPIMWRRDKCGISILTMENAHPQYNRCPVFYVPLRKFMQCGGLWTVVGLCTVFWEPPLYGIPRDHEENERVKGAYLIEFASDLAPICKEWARGCIEQCSQKAKDEVFVEIILFNEALKTEMMDAISRHKLTVSICESTNAYTVI
jgi:hypothetical protein